MSQMKESEFRWENVGNCDDDERCPGPQQDTEDPELILKERLTGEMQRSTKFQLGLSSSIIHQQRRNQILNSDTSIRTGKTNQKVDVFSEETDHTG